MRSLITREAIRPASLRSRVNTARHSGWSTRRWESASATVERDLCGKAWLTTSTSKDEDASWYESSGKDPRSTPCGITSHRTAGQSDHADTSRAIACDGVITAALWAIA